MGHTISKQTSPYLFIGVRTSNENKVFRRLISSEENRIFVNGKRELTGAESKIDKDGDSLCHYVSEGAYIVGIYLTGPKEDDVYGIVTIRDSSNKTFDFACDVRVGEEKTEVWKTQYVSPGWETSNVAISSVGISLTKQDCTVLTNLASSLRPQKRVMQAQGAGFIGWLEDIVYHNPIGLISDTNAWMFFTQTVLLNRKYVKAKYFAPGYLLTAMRWERFTQTSWTSGNGDNDTGKGTITMTVMNANNHTITYTAAQKNVLSVNNTFISVNQNKIIKSIEYLVVPGFTSIEMDFLIVNTPEICDYACPEEVDFDADTYEEAKTQQQTTQVMVAQPIIVSKIQHPEQLEPKQIEFIEKKSDKIVENNLETVDTTQTQQQLQPTTVTYDFVTTTIVILLLFVLLIIVCYFLYQKYESDFQVRVLEERKKIEASLPSTKSIDELIEELKKSRSSL